MSKILKKEQFDKILRQYYLERYGERETDIWYEQPAVNVCTFKRDDKYISLKAHILTGDVEEFVE
ncbi:MAG: hypothetical protein E7593_04560 [Ruminococcaceae bacterium]|nr:hypothetical protein [Oscillospiraceae bacterium]